jgi:Fe-S-cluster containining protein
MREWQCQKEGDCCTRPDAVVMTEQEWAVLSATPQAHAKTIAIDSDGGWVAMKAGPCPFFDSVHRLCSVYKSRPYQCRRYQCGRWNAQSEPYLSNPMMLIKSNNDLRWSYAKNQKAHQPWALEHGWRAE